jgi:hypothetical protein
MIHGGGTFGPLARSPAKSKISVHGRNRIEHAEESEDRALKIPADSCASEKHVSSFFLLLEGR